MNTSELIQLANFLLSVSFEAAAKIPAIKAALEQTEEMTDEDRAAFEALKASNYAKDHWN